MEEDASSRGWAARAGCRWLAYAILWTLAVGVGLISAFHPILGVASGVLGCLLALSLPLLFITLFEVTWSRRFRRDLPFMCLPWLGSLVVAIGMVALLEASSFITAMVSTKTLDSAKTFMDLFAERPGKDLRRKNLPLTVCIQNAFVKTDWEAGKLRCRNRDGHVECVPAFVAAPIFNDKALADAALADDIVAWAVSRGRHVDANYEPDGRLCGYVHGRLELDFHLSDYRLAVLRIIRDHHLVLSQHVDVIHVTPPPGEIPAIPASGASQSQKDTSATKQAEEDSYSSPELEARPLLLIEAPHEVTHVEQVSLMAAVLLLCLCPCTGPLPLAAILIFVCWVGSDRSAARHVVPQADYIDDYDFDGGEPHGTFFNP